MIDAGEFDLLLRGAATGLLLLHAIVLVLPGQPRPAARAALAGWALSLIGYLAGQRPELLLGLPRPLALVLLALAVTGAGWFWIAMRAAFDDAFAWRPPFIAALMALLALGLAANLPYFPPPGGTNFVTPPAWVPAVSTIHGAALFGFALAALAEVGRGWRADLVEARRIARRWVALGVAVYGVASLAVELALRGHDVGLLLPALHVAMITALALALAVLLIRHSLDDLLGLSPTASPRAPAPVVLTAEPAPAAPAPADPALQALQRAISETRLYRRDDLTLAALAHELGMGETALRTLINQKLGFRNFNDFLHHHRLNEAQARLVAEQLPILSIALDCGYGSIGPFNRAFKLRFGMTPSAWRAKAR
jgi:AraC-like DNA-binding protein